MSAIKRWLEDHISEITDEELLEDGYEHMRECFTGRRKES